MIHGRRRHGSSTLRHGGDGLGPSTLVRTACGAGAGVPVVKQWQSSVSTRTGSADVLTALGVEDRWRHQISPGNACNSELRVLLRPLFSSGLENVAAVGVRSASRRSSTASAASANPAGAKRQLLGVDGSIWLDLMPTPWPCSTRQRAFVLCSRDGLDESACRAQVPFASACS